MTPIGYLGFSLTSGETLLLPQGTPFQLVRAVEDTPPPLKKAAKPKREGRQETRPTRAGPKAGKTRQRVQGYLAKHPAATASEMGRALGISPQGVDYHLKALRK